MTQVQDPTHGSMSGAQSGRMEMHDGEDFVCSNCGCEIMLKHHGDPAKMQNMRPFTCCCGTQMQPEHPQGGQSRSSR